jgi:C4-dicarboxylate-specific signal transduction histidine kinase
MSWKAVADQGRIYAMGRDVTELKNAEDKLHETRRELAQIARRTTLAAMTAGIAHEIKQPLAAIVANAAAGLHLLNRTAPEIDEAHATFKDIEADGHRASEVIQSVRALFSHSNQPGTLLDANELIREAIALVRADLEAAGIAIRLELADRLPLISAHKGQLQQVVLNLVTNAADAMRSSTDRSRVLWVRSEASKSNSVMVSVEDTGTGIDPNNFDRIFDAFFTTKVNGMGMGLAICRSIVEAHGGTLSVSAAVPHGSVFHVLLPAQP